MRREATHDEDAIRFQPARVEGAADVDEVLVSRDALELVSGGKRLTCPFLAFARGREISSGRVPVGEMHFSKSSYPDSRFVFYTTPRIVVFMPADGPTTYPRSHFWRVQEVLRDGGFKLYEDGPPTVPPAVLDPRPGRTLAYALAVLAFSWAYALAGFLPGPAGPAWRDVLTSNPRNPSVGLAFMLPATVVPAMLALRHARTMRALLAVTGMSFLAAAAFEWMLRQVIHAWAPLEWPPFDDPFWSGRRLVTLLIAVTVAALIGWSWRGAFLEPIVPPAKAPGDPAAG